MPAAAAQAAQALDAPAPRKPDRVQRLCADRFMRFYWRHCFQCESLSSSPHVCHIIALEGRGWGIVLDSAMPACAGSVLTQQQVPPPTHPAIRSHPTFDSPLSAAQSGACRKRAQPHALYAPLRICRCFGVQTLPSTAAAANAATNSSVGCRMRSSFTHGTLLSSASPAHSVCTPPAGSALPAWNTTEPLGTAKRSKALSRSQGDLTEPNHLAVATAHCG